MSEEGNRLIEPEPRKIKYPRLDGWLQSNNTLEGVIEFLLQEVAIQDAEIKRLKEQLSFVEDEEDRERETENKFREIEMWTENHLRVRHGVTPEDVSER